MEWASCQWKRSDRTTVEYCGINCSRPERQYEWSKYPTNLRIFCSGYSSSLCDYPRSSRSDRTPECSSTSARPASPRCWLWKWRHTRHQQHLLLLVSRMSDCWRARHNNGKQPSDLFECVRASAVQSISSMNTAQAAVADATVCSVGGDSFSLLWLILVDWPSREQSQPKSAVALCCASMEQLSDILVQTVADTISQDLKEQLVIPNAWSENAKN